MIEGRCRPKNVLLARHKALSGQKRASTDQQIIFSEHDKAFLSQTEACSSLRPTNRALRKIQGQLSLIRDPSEPQVVISGRQNALLCRKRALLNRKKALSAQHRDLLDRHRGILGQRDHQTERWSSQADKGSSKTEKALPRPTQISLRPTAGHFSQKLALFR